MAGLRSEAHVLSQQLLAAQVCVGGRREEGPVDFPRPRVSPAPSPASQAAAARGQSQLASLQLALQQAQGPFTQQSGGAPGGAAAGLSLPPPPLPGATVMSDEPAPAAVGGGAQLQTLRCANCADVEVMRERYKAAFKDHLGASAAPGLLLQGLPLLRPAAAGKYTEAVYRLTGWTIKVGNPGPGGECAN